MALQALVHRSAAFQQMYVDVLARQQRQIAFLLTIVMTNARPMFDEPVQQKVSQLVRNLLHPHVVSCCCMSWVCLKHRCQALTAY